MKIASLACAGLLAATAARAEFLLTPSAMPAASVTAMAPERVLVPPRPRTPSQPKAVGFGDDVPLHVAVRQIAPNETAIVYGDGVDREAPVTWRGGRAWNLVLADAVRPLNLKITRAPGQVTIAR